MALRFNPPPNWPAPPEGFNPPAGWQPDPAWGPAPEGWQLWVEDSAPGSSAGSAPQAGSAADAGWAPTQAVPTGSSAPVADPTGQSASAPSGDYAAGGSPYAANMNYAQSPTPYHNQQQAPGAPPQAAGWQPIDVGQGGAPAGNKPVTKQWWFWTIIAVVVLALVIGIVVALTGGDDDEDNRSTTTTSSTSDTSNDSSNDSAKEQPTSSSDDSNADDSKKDDSGSSDDNVATTMDNPGDPQAGSMSFKAGKYATDPDASIEVQVGSVEWDATAAIKEEAGKYSYKEPGNGNVYMRVPVTVTYHGKGQMSSFDVSVDYVRNGNTTEPASMYLDSAFTYQDMPRDGGSATGYFIFIISEDDANAQEGVFAVSGFRGDELYVAAKTF